MGAWTRRHPVTAFLLIAFGVPWIGWTFRGFMFDGEWFSQGARGAIGWVLFYFGCGPLLGGFIVTAMTRGRSGVRALLRRCIDWRVNGWWWAYAILLPIVLAGVSRGVLAALAGVELGSFDPLGLAVLFTPGILLIFTIGPLCEEAGWRGFLLPNLLESYSPLPASLLIGILWTVWHLPLSFTLSAYEGIFGEPGQFVSYLVLVTAFSVHFTWLHRYGRGSLLLVMVFHWTVNARNPVFSRLFPEVSSETWSSLNASPAFAVATVLPWVLTAAALGIMMRSWGDGRPTSRPGPSS